MFDCCPTCFCTKSSATHAGKASQHWQHTATQLSSSEPFHHVSPGTQRPSKQKPLHVEYTPQVRNNYCDTLNPDVQQHIGKVALTLQAGRTSLSNNPLPQPQLCLLALLAAWQKPAQVPRVSARRNPGRIVWPFLQIRGWEKIQPKLFATDDPSLGDPRGRESADLPRAIKSSKIQ